MNGTTSRQVWDGDNIVYEANNDWAKVASYYRGTNLVAIDNGVIDYYLYNSHGDVVGMKNEGSTIVYDAFGNQKQDTIENYNPFRYNGQYTDEETGLIYLRARYYHPATGRFISEDPAKDGLNWYTYAGNNPVMFVDPFGLDAWIYYGIDQAEIAKRDYEVIKSKYPDEEVHLVPVNTPDDLINEWEAMDGEISYVEINLHGDPYNLYSSDSQSIDITKLKDKEINILVNLAFNQDHLDVDNNVTDQLLKNNSIDNMVASDGTVYWQYWNESNNVEYWSDVDSEWQQYVTSGRITNEGFMYTRYFPIKLSDIMFKNKPYKNNMCLFYDPILKVQKTHTSIGKYFSSLEDILEALGEQ